ncbi:MAG: DUF2716 domain-containing protein [Clostridia bacterium]|nr:DUF2716 domain-containing protein [Clostridia bacterium]
MLLDRTQAYSEIWDKVFDKLHFQPCCEEGADTPVPFRIVEPYAVYDIKNMTDGQRGLLDSTIGDVFIRITQSGQLIYALDWQHSAFLYDPRDPSGQQSLWVDDPDQPFGRYLAEFPEFYPDGDYYFFIEENFAFGYLAHPWRQEVWIFGDDLIREMDAIHKKLGWSRIKNE